MGRYSRSRTPDAPLLRAVHATDGQIGSYALVGAFSLLSAALVSGSTVGEWVKLGFITPALIATVLIVGFGPRRRVVDDPSERPSDVDVATEEQSRRLAALHLAVLGVVAVSLVIVSGAKGALVMFAISAAHVVALTVLRWRLRRLELRLGAPIYQRLRAAIWREPLWAYRDPGHGNPEIAAALGRSGVT